MVVVGREISAIVLDDGIRFDSNPRRADLIREDLEYGGLRLKTSATMAGARISVTVDIGFGDAVELGMEEIELPALLDLPAPRSSRASAPRLCPRNCHRGKISSHGGAWEEGALLHTPGRLGAFGVAGLWDRSKRDDGTQVLSCTLITIPPNELMAREHNVKRRMPAVLRKKDHERWPAESPEEAQAVLMPYPSDLTVAWQVSRKVNNVKGSNDASLIDPGRGTRLSSRFCGLKSTRLARRREYQ
jgi:hypothetical protein